MTKVPRPDPQDGLSLVRRLTGNEEQLLRSAYADALQLLENEWAAKSLEREVFWTNLWQHSGGAPPMALPHAAELDAWVRDLVRQNYDAPIELDGYGFVVNPCGSRAQAWHIDYSMDYSVLFIPMSPLTPNNAPQYLVLSPSLPDEIYKRATLDSDVVDIDALLDGGDFVSVRQLLVKPYSLTKLEFGTIHRGISNTETFERVMFWASVKKPWVSLPVEPLLHTFEK